MVKVKAVINPTCKNVIRFIFNAIYESYFGINCIKDYVKDLLEMDTKHSVC